MSAKRYPFHLLLADEWVDVPGAEVTLPALRNYVSLLGRRWGVAFSVFTRDYGKTIRVLRRSAAYVAADGARGAVTVPDDVPAGLPEAEEAARALLHDFTDREGSAALIYKMPLRRDTPADILAAYDPEARQVFEAWVKRDDIDSSAAAAALLADEGLAPQLG